MKDQSEFQPAAARPGPDAPPDRAVDVAYKDLRLSPQLRFTVATVLLARRWRALLDDHLRPLGYSSPRMEALAAIARTRPTTTQIGIARVLSVEGGTFTRMLDALESDGLVERQADPNDRRSKRAQLTRTGTRELSEILAVGQSLRAWLLDGMNQDEIVKVGELMTRLVQRLESGAPRD